MRIIITFIIALLLYSCSDKNVNRDDIAVCTIKNKIILSEIEKFIDSTKGSRLYDDCEFIWLGIFSDSLGTPEAKTEVNIQYWARSCFCFEDIFIPCQKIKKKRVVIWTGFGAYGDESQITIDSVFHKKLLHDVCLEKEKLDSISRKRSYDLMNSGYPYRTLSFVIRDGVIVDSTYNFEKESLLIY